MKNIIIITLFILSINAIKIEKEIQPERPLKRSIFNYSRDSNGTTILGVVLLIIGIIIDIVLFLLIIDLLYRRRITEDDLKDFKNINSKLEKKKVKEN